MAGRRLGAGPMPALFSLGAVAHARPFSGRGVGQGPSVHGGHITMTKTRPVNHYDEAWDNTNLRENIGLHIVKHLCDE